MKSCYISVTARPEQGFSDVSGFINLPTPLHGKYEIGLVYCSFDPVWNFMSNLSMTLDSIVDGTDMKPIAITFDEMAATDTISFIALVQSKIASVFGTDMRKASTKLKISEKDNQLIMQLQSGCKLNTSPNLAHILGVNHEIENKDKAKKVITLKPKELPLLNLDKYYISCDEMMSNFVSHNSNTAKCLHFYLFKFSHFCFVLSHLF